MSKSRPWTRRKIAAGYYEYDLWYGLGTATIQLIAASEGAPVSDAWMTTLPGQRHPDDAYARLKDAERDLDHWTQEAVRNETHPAAVPLPRVEDFTSGLQQYAVELSQRKLSDEQFAELRRIDGELGELLDWIDEGDE